MKRKVCLRRYAHHVSEVKSAEMDSTRDGVKDVLLITLVAVLGFSAATALGTPAVWPAWFGPVELVLGVLCCACLWWRRVHPLAVATVLVIAGALLASVSVAPLVA